MRLAKFPITLALISSGVMVWFLSQRHSGFLLYFVALLLIPWIIQSIWVIARRPEQRKTRSWLLAIWLVAVTIVISVHVFYAVSARNYAQAIADSIKRHIKERGVCPTTLTDVGYSDKQFREELGMGGYDCKSGKPRLFYASTFTVFETEHYDFELRRWRHAGD